MNRRSSVPKLLRHRASGRAYAIFSERQVYFGKWGTPEAEEAYQRALAKWLAGQQVAPPRQNPTGQIMVAELVLQYLRHAKTYYRRAEGRPGEAGDLAVALKPLVQLYGRTPAEKFGLSDLAVIRDQWVREGLSRPYVNKQLGRVKRAFKWATEQLLIPPTTLAGLQILSGLRKGRTEAVELEPIQPVSWERVEATLPFLRPQVRALVLLGWYTGARPGELVIMRWADVDTTRATWFYRPTTHKMAWRGKDRVIAIGPKGQEVLQPWRRLDREAYIFSPKEAETARRDELRAHRETPLWPSHLEAKAAQARARAESGRTRRLGDHYTNLSFRQAIQRACKLAGVPHWHPNQLRHAFATEVAGKHGLAVAQVMLGHSCPTTTAIYAARDLAVAERVIRDF